ncbi:hypothetical protein AMS68_004077 [Peltaster fructicola]|uniref:Uncharacterized protein n=1 Tax=Peltaster fructicola TaxID=286661 RepID=A0A6H0XVT6_9PEZI|nr:hypothetical protein AMS68_004077 [Peltaster fructicola]
MDNIDNIVTLQLPGFALPLTYDLPGEARFAHGINEYFQAPAVTRVEFEITATINSITNVTDWQTDVFDDLILESWKGEFGSSLSDKSWQWCVTELRDKAVEFNKKGFVRVLDTGSCVCKSSIINCVDKFQALDHLHEDSTCIVDPQLYPLVWGETQIRDTSLSTIHHMLQPGMISPSQQELDLELEELDSTCAERLAQRRKGFREDVSDNAYDPCQHWWSTRYQALPCEYSGGIRSYINNLPPSTKYQAIEQIIRASIPMWNECLIKGSSKDARESLGQTQRGRYPLRIVTFGPEWHNRLPEWARVFSDHEIAMMELYAETRALVHDNIKPTDWHRHCNARHTLKKLRYLEGAPKVPQVTEEHWKLAESYLGKRLDRSVDVWPEIQSTSDLRRYWTHPEPVISYEDWRTGQHVDSAIVSMVRQQVGYENESQKLALPTHEQYQVVLPDDLQLIVKISAEAQDWGLDGHMNEHIVARALYVYHGACEVSFAQETPLPLDVYRLRGVRQPRNMCEPYRYDSIPWADDMSAFLDTFGIEESDLDGIPMQETGTISMTPGRLITWPNVLEYCIEGEARYILISLVDPNIKICSTAHVPPQQEDWWRKAVSQVLQQRLPVELVDWIMSYYEPPMTRERAQRHKEEMQKEDQYLTMARHASMIDWDLHGSDQ